MPRRSTPLSAADGALARFALDLRELRSRAPADRETSIYRLAQKPWANAKTATIYAALQGRVLPSRETLATIVIAWAPRPQEELSQWMRRRDRCEATLATPTQSASERTRGRIQATVEQDTAQVVAFGQEMRRRRLQAGLSLANLAALMHYSRSHISKIENGWKRPTLDFGRRADAALQAGGELDRLAEAVNPVAAVR